MNDSTAATIEVLDALITYTATHAKRSADPQLRIAFSKEELQLRSRKKELEGQEEPVAPEMPAGAADGSPDGRAAHAMGLHGTGSAQG